MKRDLNSWDKFCNYLWFDKKLNIWLDISKINFTSKEIKNLEDKFIDVFSFYPIINSYEIKKTLKLNCLYSKTYLFEDKNLNKFK